MTHTQFHYTISFNTTRINGDSMQYFRSERREKNERFRVFIRVNEGLPPFGRELALGLLPWLTLIFYIKKSKVSFLYSQTALDVDFFGQFKNAQLLEKVVENLTDQMRFVAISRNSHTSKIIFKI